MRSILKQSLKLFTMCVAVIFIFTLNQSAAQAQDLTVDGSTTGSKFTPGGNSLGGLSFSGINFGGTTTNGVLDISDMGTLTIDLAPGTSGEALGIFTFRVGFGLPDGVTFNPVEISGEVFSSYTDASNFALIDFNNNPSVVTFSGANGTGVFSLALDDVCLFQGRRCSFNEISKLRRHKSLNAFALNTAKSGDGNVKFVKAKGSSSMLAPQQTQTSFKISATITLLPFTPILPPTSEEQCKKGGWRTFNNPPFRNQGACVSFVNRSK